MLSFPLGLKSLKIMVTWSSCAVRSAELPMIMSMLWKRMGDSGKNWRHVYKVRFAPLLGSKICLMYCAPLICGLLRYFLYNACTDEWARFYLFHFMQSLIVLDFFIKHGSEQSIREMRYHIVDLQTLTSFQYMDENYQDVGQSGLYLISIKYFTLYRSPHLGLASPHTTFAVRERAKKVLELLHDEKRMKEERAKAQQNRNKYQGYGSDSSMRGGPRSCTYTLLHASVPLRGVNSPARLLFFRWL